MLGLSSIDADEAVAPRSNIAAAALSPNSPAVKRAIGKALRWLRAQQTSQGGWSFGGGGNFGGQPETYDVGVTGLVGLALLESHAEKTDPSVQAAARFVRRELVRHTKAQGIGTYNAATSVLFLHELGEPADARLRNDLIRALRQGLYADGGWGYQVTSSPGANQDRIRMGSDSSNTQFAVLALLAGSKRTETVDAAFERAARRFLQMPGQGWRYKPSHSDSLSMTCAGLITVAAAETRGTLEPGEFDRKALAGTGDAAGGSRFDRAYRYFVEMVPRSHEATRRWMANNGAIKSTGAGVRIGVDYRSGRRTRTNVGGGTMQTLPRSLWLDYYELWSIERVAVAFSLDRIGEFDWYSSGADLLVKLQDADGAWVDGRYGKAAATAFALLFLNKADLAPEIAYAIAETSDPTDFPCVWSMRRSDRLPVWKLRFSVRDADDYVRLVERLGGRVGLVVGRSVAWFDHPAGQRDEVRHSRTSRLARASALWTHQGARIDSAIARLLNVKGAERVVVMLPRSLQRALEKQFVEQRRVDGTERSGEVRMSLGAGPIDAASIDPENVHLTPLAP